MTHLWILHSYWIYKDALPIQMYEKQQPAQALKFLCLCFEKERNSYCFGATFVNNDQIFISEQAIPD